MRLKKSLLLCAVAMPVFPMAAHAVGHYQIDDLRSQCEEQRQNTQVGNFNIDMLCSGRFSHWERETAHYRLAQGAFGHLAASTKDGRFTCDKSMFAMQLPDYVGQCGVYTRLETRAPVGGIRIRLNNCDDLRPEKIEALCAEQVIAYCADQHVAVDSDEDSSSSSSSQGHDGLCTVVPVEVVDTCNVR